MNALTLITVAGDRNFFYPSLNYFSSSFLCSFFRCIHTKITHVKAHSTHHHYYPVLCSVELCCLFLLVNIHNVSDANVADNVTIWWQSCCPYHLTYAAFYHLNRYRTCCTIPIVVNYIQCCTVSTFHDMICCQWPYLTWIDHCDCFQLIYFPIILWIFYHV